MTAVLDSGALIAIDGRDRKVGAMLRVLQREAEPVRTSAGPVAQIWCAGRQQVNLARSLPGLDVAVLDELAAKKAGELLGTSGTSDLVDAYVALLVRPGEQVLTSDEQDIKALLRTRRVKATVVQAEKANAAGLVRSRARRCATASGWVGDQGPRRSAQKRSP